MTYTERTARRHAEQMQRRRRQLEQWEIKQLNREARKHREGAKA